MYDLIVIGGGLAGCAAAISAARTGAKVLLAEKFNALGGAAAVNLVTPFMPYFTHNKDGKREMLSCGIFAEIIENMDKYSGSMLPNHQDFNGEFLKIVLMEMALKENIALLFDCLLTDVKTENGKILSVVLSGAGGNKEYSAKYYIDCTGNGDLAFKSGVSCRLGREDGLCQPMTLCFRMGNVDIEEYRREMPEINRLYSEYKQAGKIKNPREDVLTFFHPADGILHFNSTRVVKLNPTDTEDLSRAEIEGRRQLIELYGFLKSNFKAFKNATLLSSAAQIGIRESRMINGEHILTAEELKSQTVFEDSIAVGNYDIDIHNPEGTGTSHYFFKSGEYYTIPYRSLLPREVDNLLVAGRCISATHEAQASIRIMPICCTLGEAAGEAAGVALARKCSFKDIDVKALQTALTSHGARIR